jgi:hypothetical protein
MASTPDIRVSKSSSPTKLTDLPEELLEDIFKYLLPIDNPGRDIAEVENCVAVSLTSKQFRRKLRPHILSLDGNTECVGQLPAECLPAGYIKYLVRDSDSGPVKVRVVVSTPYCVRHIVRDWMGYRAWGSRLPLWLPFLTSSRRLLKERLDG